MPARLGLTLGCSAAPSWEHLPHAVALGGVQLPCSGRGALPAARAGLTHRVPATPAHLALCPKGRLVSNIALACPCGHSHRSMTKSGFDIDERCAVERRALLECATAAVSGGSAGWTG